MNRTTAITITDLLMGREECFVQIWECERRIHQILGQPYPMPPPPQLPSRTRTTKPSRRRPPQPVRIRRLNPNEHAYQVRVRLDDDQHLDLVELDPDILRTLLNADQPPLQLHRITTVRLDRDGSVADLIETIYAAPTDRAATTLASAD